MAVVNVPRSSQQTPLRVPFSPLAPIAAHHRTIPPSPSQPGVVNDAVRSQGPPRFRGCSSSSFQTDPLNEICSVSKVKNVGGVIKTYQSPNEANNNNNNNNVTNAPILCFSHCDESKHVLCLVLPPACPICQSPLTKSLHSTSSNDFGLSTSASTDNFDPDFSAHSTSETRAFSSFPTTEPSALPPRLNRRLLEGNRVRQTKDQRRIFSPFFTPLQPSDDRGGIDHESLRLSSSPSSPRSLSSPSRSPSLPSTSRAIFLLPSPFRRGSDSSCSIVIRPSLGSFLNDYRLYDDLHIGIADSKGVVHDFDKGGIRVRRNYWNQCLVLNCRQLRNFSSSSPAPSFSTSSSSSSTTTTFSRAQWDETLKRCIDVARWTVDGRDAYDGDINNCLDFVLRFLQLWNASPSTSSTSNVSSTRESDRVAFTRRRLLPLMESSMKYILLYRKLLRTKVWVHEDA